MKSPWQYWLFYSIGVLLVVLTLGWLTQQSLQLDQAEALSRRQAEQEENIGRALWRMDVRMMPLIATEAARPHFVYQPFYPTTPNEPTDNLPPNASPLLLERPEFILLNFQVDDSNRWTSAQVPPADKYALALQCGARPTEILNCESQLSSLQNELTFPTLIKKLPAEAVTKAGEDLAGTDAKFLDNANFDNMMQSELIPDQQARPARFNEGAVQLQRQQTLNTSDLAKRTAQVQMLAQREFENQRANLKGAPAATVTEGICRPVWVGNRLILARRVLTNGRTVIQGCLLDRGKIEAALLAEASDLVPSLELQPVTQTSGAPVTRMLATLPFQLVVPPPVLQPIWTPIRTTLCFAWAGTLLFAVAGALLLHGVLSLSERRATFVSAVTHELRTPLTTFRLYADLLADDMLPHPEQKQKYLQTLRVEAERLVRLVDNVLSFARLERGRSPQQRIPVTVQGLFDRFTDRLKDRAEQASLQLHVESDRPLKALSVQTDPSAVEQILFNLIDNAAKYAGRADDRRLHLQVAEAKRWIEIRLSDHGPGLDSSAQRKLFKPFCKSAQDAAHSAPGVGLGLALCRRLARDLGGELSLESNTAHGATFLLRLAKLASPTHS